MQIRSMRRDEAEDGKMLHRPDEDIPRRPRLRVKSKNGDETRQGSESGPTVRAGSLYNSSEEAKPAANGQQTSAAVPDDSSTGLPRIDTEKGPSPYATHRPPPNDETAEKAELAAATGGVRPEAKSDRRVSAGFVLGIALIAIALIGGIWLARLSNRMASLEERISALEPAATSRSPGP